MSDADTEVLTPTPATQVLSQSQDSDESAGHMRQAAELVYKVRWWAYYKQCVTAWWDCGRGGGVDRGWRGDRGMGIGSLQDRATASGICEAAGASYFFASFFPLLVPPHTRTK